ncbi:serine hydrolase [Cryobacterium sp. Y11]|uniref:serine hydrolase domain-containing protein n=1 Tax=Cryobacterium sp. Y11 TaxID=2045016 RepID=UPI000CE3C2CE|nr:serine hydrolase [Cryobacterium sp. Y11]
MTGVRKLLTAALTAPTPAFSGAVVIAAVNGEVAIRECVGTIARWSDDLGTDWPGQTASISTDTRFDLASLTKIATAATLLAALAEHGLNSRIRVAELLPELSSEMTAHHLLSHTAGWPAEWLDHDPGNDAWARFRSLPALNPPGEVYRYSCVSYVWAGLAIESLTGERLDVAMTRLLLAPLGMTQTGFNPAPHLLATTAATEFQPGRGLVHGVVHDETAWALGGIAGNAGLFGAATDVLLLAEALRTGHPSLVSRDEMTTDQLRFYPGLRNRPAYGQALGPRVADRQWMGALADTGAIGHTGFTGTSLVTQPGGIHSVVFLSNRVHVSRHTTDLSILRGHVADTVAKLKG